MFQTVNGNRSRNQEFRRIYRGMSPGPPFGGATLSAFTVPPRGGLRFAADPHIVCRPQRAAPTAFGRSGADPDSVLASIPELAPGHGQPQSALSTPIREGRRTRARSSRTVQRRRVSGRTDVIIDEDPRGMAPLFPHHLDPRFLRCGLSGTA